MENESPDYLLKSLSFFEMYFWKDLVFQIVGKSQLCSLYLRMSEREVYD